MNPFHLAIPVADIEQARKFYVDIMGCVVGRSDKAWVDLNFFGHQLVCHLDRSIEFSKPVTNPVDNHDVPVPHFGVVLTMEDWQDLAERLQSKVEFIIEPYIRFKGKPGEQATMFFKDPSGNAIEIKAFRDVEAQLFAR